jgi:hypothetical protein
MPLSYYDKKKIVTPPAELRSRLPEIDGPATELEELRERLRIESRNLVELEHARDAAVEQDTQAHAAALRTGKSDPGRKLTGKAEKLLADKQPIVDALKAAVTGATADLVAAVEEHGEGYKVALAGEAEEQRADARGLLSQVSEKVSQRQQTVALRSWLDNPILFAPQKVQKRVESMAQPNGSTPSVDVVVAALAEALDPPAPPKRTNPAQWGKEPASA